MYFPLVTVGYNSQAETFVSFNFFEFMFNPRALFSWIVISAACFLPFKMAKDLGILLYPRYRDLLVQESEEIERIRMEIMKRNKHLLDLDLEENEAEFKKKRRHWIQINNL